MKKLFFCLIIFLQVLSLLAVAEKKSDLKGPIISPEEKEKVIIGALGIQPSSIEKKIFDLAKAKNYVAINELVEKTTDPNDLKKFVMLQLTLGFYIADRINFDMDPEESQTHRYPPQTSITPTSSDNPIQLNWLYLLRESKLELNGIKLNNRNIAFELHSSLILINELLLDLGYRHHIEISNNIPLIKKIIAENFKELFDRLFIVMYRKPGGKFEPPK